ncbi:DUF5691 domain-containing protein [Naumannella halotolerans]|uniref:Uncharacterized protein n=1 Tax=Naumannella halotolerans TaxID=993414 RepID=A0A4R7IYU1_9ACTN|nr:DUF5691 domain-containing protein [Naumannella halotolerans]TDT29890.1 hypothetical protein CLV29_2912 [Naumannella halotolerans]
MTAETGAEVAGSEPQADGPAPRFADLAAAAVLGVASREVVLSTLAPDLQPVAAEPAEALLDTAALLSAGLRTVVPTVQVGPPDPPVTESRPTNSTVVDQLLLRLAEDRPLLLLALRRIRAAGQVLPPLRVPALLTATRTNAGGVSGTELADALLPVLGTVGEWIAGQHPRWSILTRPVTEGWPDAEPAEQIAWFRRVRAAHPQAAAELLGADAADFGAAQRAELVAALADGLSETDTALLDAFAADRSLPVRSTAQSLAWRLPGTAEAERAAENARRSVRIRPGAITLSEGATDAIAAVVPHRWPEIFGVEAAAALAVPGGDKLIRGLARAAVRFGDAETAYWVLRFSRPGEDLPQLWFGLPDEERADRVMTSLVRKPQTSEALEQWAQWPSQLSRRLAFWMEERLRKEHSVPLMDLWVTRVPDADVPAATGYARHLAFEARGPAHRRAWERAAERLNLRASILRNLPLTDDAPARTPNQGGTP